MTALAAARRQAPKVLASSVVVLLVTTVMVLTVEGAASVAVTLRGESGQVPLERAHTDFDRDLGWINSRRVRLEDLYGKGRYLQTNSQRFRNREDFSPEIPRDKVRAVCTGDSFTLGYGVSNDDAWCELLGKEDSRLQTVNMGQGGYGVDQAYLWYRRDGLNLKSDVLLFAFTATDLGRMMCTTFLGYPKPVLSVEKGRPVINRHASFAGYLGRGVRQRLRPLQNLRFIEWWQPRALAEKNVQLDFRAMNMEEARKLALAMFEDLASVQAERNASWMVVLLPTLDDYTKSEADEWRGFLSDELGKRSIPFLDLVTALRSMPESTVALLYRGHYNEVGNRWVADKVYEALTQLPRVHARLEQIGSPSTPIARLLGNEIRLELEEIPLSGAQIMPGTVKGLAPLMVDGSLETRWDSGGVQNGQEQVLVDLGKPMSIRQITLELGKWGYDYARRLAVDVGNDESGLVEVLNASGEKVLSKHVGGSGELQVLTFRESVETRYVRIRQTELAPQNYWSVAEIKVFREK